MRVSSILDILSQLENCRNNLVTLELNYKNKPKGASYLRAKSSILEKIPYLVKKAESLGTNGNLFHITFEYFEGNNLFKGEMYLQNLEESSISLLVKNLKKYQSIKPESLIVTEIILGTVKKLSKLN